MSLISPSKNDLRQALLAQRMALTPTLRSMLEREINTCLIQWAQKNAYQRIGIYFPLKGEVDLGLFKAWFEYQGGQVYYPQPLYGGIYYISERKHNGFYRASQHHVLEPGDDWESLFSADFLRPFYAPQALLIPLIGIDQKGYRLGWGKGCFDRLLAVFKVKTPTIPCLGVGFSCQFLPSLPHDCWDRPLDGWVSERGLQFFGA